LKGATGPQINWASGLISTKKGGGKKSGSLGKDCDKGTLTQRSDGNDEREFPPDLDDVYSLANTKNA